MSASAEAWWGYSPEHGWVVLDRTIPCNRAGQKCRPLLFVRCCDGKAIWEDFQNWKSPSYVFHEPYMKSIGLEERARTEATLIRYQDRWAEFHDIAIRSIQEQEEQLPKTLQADLKSDLRKVSDSRELLRLAGRYRDQKALDKAMATCKMALSIFPKCEEKAVVVMSSILRQMGKFERAVELTERFRGSNNPALLTTRAAALCDIEDWESAKKTIGKALAIIKGVSKAGEAFGVVGRIKAARPDLYKT